MKKRLDVYALPELAPEQAPETPLEGASVAIDVLRATTTIATALAAGAEKVVPFLRVDEATAAKNALTATRPDAAARILLGGERRGLPIDGFDLGNSPDAYVAERVAGKTLFFTTTNGTKAILRRRGVVLTAAFVNAEAIVARLLRDDFSEICFVCAGTDGQYTEEDLLLAGLLTDRLTLRDPNFVLNVQAEVVREEWRQKRSEPLVELLAASRGGRNLRRIKLAKDVADAARLDSLDVVPEYRVGEIRLDSNF